MRRNTIGLVWLLGLLLTVIFYVAGPDRFLMVSLRFVDDVQAVIRAIVGAFTVEAFELVRAMALGLFAVFVVLGVMASRRGFRARAALIVVTVVFLALIYPAIEGYYVPTGRWFGAFLLAGIGALVMTRRLISPWPHAPDAPPPEAGPWAARRR